MSDLPSREEAQQIEASRPDDEPNLGVWIEVKVAAKQAVWAEYLSGRLVDREAIDYEAAARALFAAVQTRLSAMFDGPSLDWDESWDSEADALVAAYRAEATATVVAVIGDTE